MINTVSDFLLNLIRAEKDKIDSFKIRHRVTIGNMYEGLTKEFLENAIFKDLNINIVSNSFIIDDSGKRSNEMDILIIDGKGKKLPFTTQFEVKIENVIAVIQVKKSLNKTSLVEGYNNLKNVVEYVDLNQYQDFNKRLFRNSYLGICKEDILVNGKLRNQSDSTTKEAIFEILKDEALLPPRILFGYNGYKSEFNLREGFVKFLFQNISTPSNLIHGFSPLYFPSLIINGNYSIIKNIGMPFNGSFDNGFWHFLSSNQNNPIYNLLEIIWTRISYKYNLNSSIFGDDLELFGSNLLLTGNIVNVNGSRGWNYDYKFLENSFLKKDFQKVEWSPIKLTLDQYSIIVHLCEQGELLINKVDAFIEKPSDINTKTDFIKELINTGLVMVIDNKYLRLTTKKCQCFIDQDGYFAAENKSGQLTRWIERKFGDNYLDLLN